eukprot:6190914-Pleurochrysis_carterae.AAC.1
MSHQPTISCRGHIARFCEKKVSPNRKALLLRRDYTEAMKYDHWACDVAVPRRMDASTTVKIVVNAVDCMGIEYGPKWFTSLAACSSLLTAAALQSAMAIEGRCFRLQNGSA